MTQGLIVMRIIYSNVYKLIFNLFKYGKSTKKEIINIE